MDYSIVKKLLDNKTYFDKLFINVDPSVVLDNQQRIAILTDAENLLVIAGAGSGKTMTMIGKVVYLIQKKGYKETEICVLAFTKKVKQELERIIHGKFGYKNVHIFTFHGLGLDIIKRGGENVNKIVEDAGQYKIIANYIKNIFKDKEKFSIFLNAFSNMLYFDSNWRDFETYEEYHIYKYEETFKKIGDINKYNSFLIENRRLYKKAIDGQYYKSMEEVDIANFLFINKIDYEYEMKYDKYLNEKKWYHPDFYIHQNEKEHYIEHIGIDQNGHNNMYTKEDLNRYKKSFKIKKSFFNEKEHSEYMIITYSKYNNGKTYLSDIEEQLIKKGYVLSKMSDEEIYKKLRDTSYDKYIANFINTIPLDFISKYKQNGYSDSYFDELISNNDDNLKKQLIVLKDMYMYYQNELKETNCIDFEDMIHKAYYIIPKLKEKDLGVDYKFLIIDEYQDISKQRFNLVNRLSNLYHANIMAVGDDWQTIYGYSGSRIELFKNFEEELDGAESVFIEKTYRNSQELIDVAGEFIQKNPSQIRKRLFSDKRIDNPIILCKYQVQKAEDANKVRSMLISKIIDHIVKEKPNAKILILGRYNNDRNKFYNQDIFTIYEEKIIYKKHPKLKISFMTIHKAKGLGFDYTILLDLVDEKRGFPSKIEDEPVIKLIIPKITEPISYPEERRLFYVALTRTKNKVFILAPQYKTSSFALEIEKYDNVRTKKFPNKEEQ